tara:strand:+ start:84 stop:392 length:309 start_codon:yes stop_codon:yes gene_type:complete
LIEIYKNKPPKNIYVPMRSYQNIEFKQKYSIKLLEKFFKEFPEEKRGRKKFKQKEIQNVRHLLYERVFQKATKINASCIGLIREKVDKELVIIKVSFFKING